MHSTVRSVVLSSTNRDVGIALYVVESRVEILLEVVVENSGLTVVLRDNGNKRSDIHRLHLSLVVVVFARSAESRRVSDSFLLSLRCIFPLFDGEIIDRVISRVVTPVGSEFDGIGCLF